MSVRRKFFVGNWKMNKTPQEATRFCEEFTASLGSHESSDVGLAANPILLSQLTGRFRSVAWFAQSSHWAESGAFTGETSVGMLKAVAVNGSLVAHSERRQMFGETDTTAGLRVAALLNAGMQAILCIGESLEQRDSGAWPEVLRGQLEAAFEATGIRNWSASLGSDPQRPNFTLAYEPVWAIGTGRAATAEQAQEAHALIRGWLTAKLGNELAQRIRIQYGGSVNLKNVEQLMGMPDIDGALVGGASLNAKDFAELILKGSRA